MRSFLAMSLMILALASAAQAQSRPEEPLPASVRPGTVPRELWHATASSIWAPGDRCLDPVEAVCAFQMPRVQAGGPSLFRPPNPGVTTSAQAHDEDLARRVDAALLTPGHRVQVKVSEGRVTLVGQARSDVERRMMIIRAMGVAGPHNVINEIGVGR